MEKISLRKYVKEIEALIEGNHIDEAITHCRHILRTYPKHIDTYRLLAKAYLETQNYKEASDVLQRILAVIPDDFIAHIGMSLVREDEGNLDGAIWHMERAFECQTANTALQDEIRRLYGVRDGVEPPRVRLTRGALVRMYARGSHYQEAISEILAALKEDPQRPDLEVILARMYYLSGLKVDAIETCGRIIKELPYCYEANRILAEVLPGTSRSEDAKIYQQRVIAVDPYYAFVTSTSVSSLEVSDNAVMVDRLEYQPGTEEMPITSWEEPSPQGGEQEVQAAEEQAPPPEIPQVATLLESPDDIHNLQSEDDQEPTPDGKEIQAAPEASDLVEDETKQANEPLKNPDDDLPEWMRDAGWSPTPQKEIPEQGSGADDLAPADIPDWLKAIAPQEDAASSPEPAEEIKEDLPVPGFEETSEESVSDTSDSDLPEWMKEGLGETIEPEIKDGEPIAASDLELNKAKPDVQEDVDQALAFLDGLTQDGTQDELPVAPIEEAGASADLPEWLTSLVGGEQEPSSSAEDETSDSVKAPELPAVDHDEQPTTEPEVIAEDLATDHPLQPEDDLPDWLRALDGEDQSALPPQGGAISPLVQKEEEPLSTEEGSPDLPEWLGSLDEGQPEPLQPTEQTPSLDALEKIEEVADEIGIGATEPEQSEESPATDLPDWLSIEEVLPSDQPETQQGQPTENPEVPQKEMAQSSSEIESEPVDSLKDESGESPEDSSIDVIMSLSEEEKSTEEVEEPPSLEQEQEPESLEQELDLQGRMSGLISEEPVEESQEAVAPSELTTEVEFDKTQPESGLSQIRGLVKAGQIDEALALCSKEIVDGNNLAEIIEDLKSFIKDHDDNSEMWQVLGDAFARNDQLQEALDAYTKAEEKLNK
jgi:tetratricopeptide (TPR) repeat protein